MDLVLVLVLEVEDRGRRPRHRGRGPLHRGMGTDETLSVEVLDVDDEVLNVGNLVDKVLQPDEVHRIAYVREVVHIVNLVPGVLIVGAHVLAVVVLEYFDLETRGPRLR